jgi:hypothetical protein
MVTVAVLTLLTPPGPVQLKEYDEVADSGPVLWAPLAALAPLQPPVALQAVAFVALHVKVDAPPLATEVGDAISVAVGMTLSVTEDTALVPPGPVQIME